MGSNTVTDTIFFFWYEVVQKYKIIFLHIFFILTEEYFQAKFSSLKVTKQHTQKDT